MQMTCDAIAAFLSFLTSPMIGKAGDAYGRLPYIFVTTILTGLPSVMLLLCDLGTVGVAPFFLASTPPVKNMSSLPLRT